MDDHDQTTEPKHSALPTEDKRADQKISNQTVRHAYPRFIFLRRSGIELQAGFVLAGDLYLDEPKLNGAALPKRTRREAQSIVRRLTKAAQSGLLPNDAMAFGWRGGRDPVNAVDTDDDTLMAAWAKDRLCIVVRVDPREDTGVLRIDSDVLRQFGLTPKKTGSA